MVEPVGDLVWQKGKKGVAAGRNGQQGLRVRPTGQECGHLRGEVVRQAEGEEEPAVRLRQRGQEDVVHHVIDAPRPGGQGAGLQISAQAQIQPGEPALGDMAELLDLRLGQGHAAAPAVGGDLSEIQPQIVLANGVQAAAQFHHRPAGEKAVPAGDDEVEVGGQSSGYICQKIRHPLIGQQMEVVKKQVVFSGVGRKILLQQFHEEGKPRAALGKLHGLEIVPQVGPGEGVLKLPPELPQVV